MVNSFQNIDNVNRRDLIIELAKHGYAMTTTEIAEELSVHPATARRMVNSLSDGWLVSRRRVPDNGNEACREYALSDEGREALRDHRKQLQEAKL